MIGNQQMVEAYFRAEEVGDVHAVVRMCADDVVVRNAAQPPTRGKAGVQAYVESFRDRTYLRRFDVGPIATEGATTFAFWQARIGFKAGVSFGPVKANRDFEVDLEGVCRFVRNPDGKIAELDVYHETTTAARLAAATRA